MGCWVMERTWRKRLIEGERNEKTENSNKNCNSRSYHLSLN